MKIRIDKIPVEMYRTIHRKDANGNRIKDKEKYIGYKKLKLVGGWRRFGHFFIDSICFLIIFYIVAFSIEIISPAYLEAPLPGDVFGIGNGLLFTFYIITSLYYFLFENKFQKTPGKWVTQTIVVNQFGEKPIAAFTLLRTITRLIPFEALSCLSDTNRGWHDRLSKTYVITKNEYEEIKIKLISLNAENQLV